MNQDFKYVLHDLTNIYIGAKYSYKELVDLDDLPFRFRMNLSNFILQYIDENMTLEDHILNMKADETAYKIYKQIRAKVKLNIYSEDAFGKNKAGYVQMECKIQDIVEGEMAKVIEENTQTVFVEEMHITTLGLLAL